MSVRQDIKGQIQTMLQGITVAAGYNMTVKQVAQGVPPDARKVNMYPSLWISSGDSTLEERPSTHLVLRNEMFWIVGYVRSGGDPESLMEDLYADVEKCLAADKTLNGLVPTSYLTDMVIAEREPIATFEMEFRVVVYRTYGQA